MRSEGALSSAEEPGMVELIGLLGWPWKLALLLLLATPAIWWLPATGWPAAGSQPWAAPAALGSAGLAALLALGAGLFALRGLLVGSPVNAAGGDDQSVLDSLQHLLESQRAQVTEATAALGRAVTAGAQLSGLAQATEKRLKATLEQPALRSGEDGQFPLASLRQAVARAETELGAATARLHAAAERAELGQSAALPASSHAADDLPARLEGVMRRLEAAVPATALSRIEHCATRLENAGVALGALPALAAQLGRNVSEIGAIASHIGQTREAAKTLNDAAITLARGVERAEEMASRLAQSAEASQTVARFTAEVQRLEAAGASLSRLPEIVQQLTAAGAEHGEAAGCQARSASGREAEMAERLQEMIRSLSAHLQRVARNEASLGDAARYLTETTDRFAAGTASLEMQAVRLQAFISIAGNHEARSAELEPLRVTLAVLEQHMAAAFHLGDTLEETRQQLKAVVSAVEAGLASRHGRAWQAAPDGKLPPVLRGTLERLGNIETDTAGLLDEAQELARQTLAGNAALPSAMAEHAAALRGGVEESIRRLNSVATALALASEGTDLRAA